MHIIDAQPTPGARTQSLAAQVRHYIVQSPRQLPSNALYDTLGSALFDAICELPWYPVTRAERRLIAAHRDEIFSAAGWPEQVVELGPGSGEKLHLLLGPSAVGPDGVRRVDLIDVSASALAAAARRILEGRSLAVGTHEDRYEDGIKRVAERRSPANRLMVLFLGSNIGNFDPPGADTFLRTIRAALEPNDAFLIGADLIKPHRDLLLAYDDPLGVTAAFNKNLLLHLNRELGATFDITRFDHRALWNTRESRVEMHLVSRVAQHVDIPQAGVSFAMRRDEAIWTESSYKYQVTGFEEMLARTGLKPTRRWIDQEGQFLLVLALAD
jgi:L-histidine N-alpha-methyltransferase